MLELFIVLSILTIASCISAIVSKVPVYSLLSIIVAFFSIAGHFLLLQAQFLAVVQIIVYAGAIVVLFLFTIMFMNLNLPLKNKKSVLFTSISIIACSLIFGFLLFSITESSKNMVLNPVNYSVGDIKILGKILLNQYFFPFEFISVLLLTAMIGAVLISKKEKEIQ